MSTLDDLLENEQQAQKLRDAVELFQASGAPVAGRTVETLNRLSAATRNIIGKNSIINLIAAPLMMSALLEVDILLKHSKPDLKKIRQLVREALIVATPAKQRKGRWQ